MKLAVTMELYAYWNRLRGARSAPERNDVDPGAIRGVLADTFVLDFDEGRGFPFRIAGSRANAIFLKELQGPLLSRALARRRPQGARFDSSLRRRRSAAVPYRRRGSAARSRGGGHRGHSPAASSPRTDPCARSRRLRRPCGAAVDRARRRGADRADLAARARSARRARDRRGTARRRQAFRSAIRPGATSTSLSIPANAGRPDAGKMRARNSALIPRR